MPTRPPRLKRKKDDVPQHMPREASNERGYTSRWRKARDGWLRAHPLCVHCEAEGRVKAANEVDHIKPHKGDMQLFWDHDNWQSLCKHHHSLKTATEDGGFGRVITNGKEN
jgi:5-methylcytosine-specific restriction protein A